MPDKLKIIIAAVVSLFLSPSCDDLRDDYEDCGVWLEFIFDHNMEYIDSFDQHVGTVDVLVFDEAGKFYSSHYATIDDLHGRKRMFLGGVSMPFGTYKIVTAGALTDHFNFSDMDGKKFIPGVTTIEQVKFALQYEATIDHEFPHIWFGPTTGIEYKADLSVWPVPLIRQTNKFNITLRRNVPRSTRTENPSPFTFEITTPESGAYDHLNRPLVNEPLCYSPYSLTSEVQPHKTGEYHLTTGKINTMRLLSDHEGDYTLAVLNSETGKELLNFDLLDLLAKSKPKTRPQTRAEEEELPFQEYLDREGDWNIDIVYDVTDGGITAISVKVNNWIVWDTGVGL